ncbi:MAG: phosphatase PAP2 family protein [Actinomycetota bacterium]|nr:phosphatase PAP2 family protein [Actinomycetota bacterium]
MDWRIFHAVNQFAGDHRLLAHGIYGFETIGVGLFAAAVLVLWLAAAPGEERGLKFAALSGAASATLALLINQVIGRVWHRPRPYQSHVHVYHLTHSHDPSFPSDHASAAFGIAFGIYTFDRRVGRVFIAIAALIAAGRVVIGAHYLSDVLASLVVAVVAAALVARFGKPLLYRAVVLLERLTDPLVRGLHERHARRSRT